MGSRAEHDTAIQRRGVRREREAQRGKERERQGTAGTKQSKLLSKTD